jgi:hypothetical protein
MARILPFILLPALTALLLAACADDDRATDRNSRLVGSGNLVSRSFDFDGFNSLDLSSAFQTDVTVGEFSITLQVDDNVIDFVEIELEGDTLRAALSPRLSISNATLLLDIAMPDVERIDAVGAIRLQLFDFTSAIDRRINLSGAASLEATLNAGRLALTVSGASSVAARNFHTRLAELKLSGTSNATITVNQEIRRIEASGASSLTYYGDPQVGVVSTSGASTATAR